MARNIVGSKFDDYVKLQIDRRQKDYSNYVGSNGVYIPDGIQQLKNTNTAFLKLTSGVDINLDKGAEATTYALFNTRFDDAFAEGIQIGAYNSAYGWQSTTGYGFSPPPGLISAEVKSLNRGSLREATIKLVCHNATQFEIIEQLYLRLGFSMLLEWGWSIYKDNTNPGLQQSYSSETMATKFLSQGIGQLEILNNIAAQRRGSCGNYDAMLGLVKNYSWDLQHDGSYDITLSLVAVGDVIESLKTNTSHPNNTLTTTNVPTDQPPLQYNAQKSTLNKILWWLADQLKAEDVYAAGKNFLQGSDTTAAKIAAGIGLKPNQNNDDINAQGEVIAAVFPQLLGVKGTTNGVQVQYFMKLGFLLRCIQNFCLLYDSSVNNQGLINIDFDKSKNFCFTYPRHGSLDPRVCLVDVIKELTGTAPPTPPSPPGTTPPPPPTAPTAGLVAQTTTYTWRSINVVIDSTTPSSDFNNDFYLLDPDLTPGSIGIGTTLLGTYASKKLFATPGGVIRDAAKYDAIIQSYTPNGGNFVTKTPGSTITVTSTSLPFYADSLSFNPVTQQITGERLITDYTSPIANEKAMNAISHATRTRIAQGPVTYDIGKDLEVITGFSEKIVKQETFEWQEYIAGFATTFHQYNVFAIAETTVTTTKFIDPNTVYTNANVTPTGTTDVTLDVNNNLFDRIRPGAQFKYDQTGKDPDTQFIGKTLNMYVNMDYVAKTLENYIDITTGAISLYDFLDKLMKGIQHAMGNINNFNIVYDQDANEFSIIDSTFIPGLGNIPAASSAFDSPTKFVTHTLDKTEGSFIRDASVKTQLSNAFATTVTVGAQANGNVVGANATALSKWNTGLTDRIILYKSTNNDPKSGSANIDTSFYSNVGLVQNLYSAINDGNITDEQIDGSKDAAVDLFNFEIGEYVNEGLIPSIGFLPINLELTMDGLSGIRIYESYTADTRMLPPRYQDNIQFITTGISHRIQNNDWTTTITSISGPKYDGKTVKAPPPIKTHNFSYSNASGWNGPAAPAGTGGGTNGCTRLANGKLVHTGNEPQFKNRQRVPRSIIFHVTDGNPNGDPQGTVDFVGRCDGKFKTGGIHYAVGRNGVIASGIPENIDSVHGDNWNKYGIGIEINHPYTVFTKGGKYYWADGYEVPANQVAILPWSYDGNKMFMEYSPAQLNALKSLVYSIWGRYPEIKKSLANYDEPLIYKALWGFPEIPKAGKNYVKNRWSSKYSDYGAYGIFGHATGGGTHGDPAPTPGLINLMKELIYDAKH